jgi:hypothetical protein
MNRLNLWRAREVTRFALIASPVLARPTTTSRVIAAP